MCSVKLFLLLTLLAVSTAQSPNPTVRVAHGVLLGSWKVSSNGRSFASFEGIPYARPPVVKYRFREPQPMKPWSGVWDATRALSSCLQYDPFPKKIVGSENCLFVNVYSPKLTPSAMLPVMVWIHGGAFMYGKGDLYDPMYLMNKDMVVVTLNYRLGPLGFLSTGDDVIPGNNGLKDQAFALHWIKNNIVMFGGNPDSITLTGGSAGAASVHYHYLSPLSRGTFNRGIAFSGSAFAPWTHTVKAAQKARTLAGLIGCPTSSSKEIAECLKYRPAEVLVHAQREMFEWTVDYFTPFVPTVESPGSREPFLTQYAYHAAKAGAMQNLPLIASVTSEEGLYPAAVYQSEPHLLQELETRWEQLASYIFEYNDTLPLNQRPTVAAKIKEHYLGGRPVSQETFPQLVQALGDRLFVVDVGKLAEIHAKHSGQPTYVYRYSYRGKFSLSDQMARNNNNYGVCHADDTLHIFRSESFDFVDDKLMSEALLNMVYSFASTGVPKFENIEWVPVRPGATEINFLEISSPTRAEMKSSSDFGHRSFWDSLGFTENENYHPNIRDEL